MLDRDIIFKSIEYAIWKCTADPHVLHRVDKALIESFNRDDFKEDIQMEDSVRLGELEDKQENYQERNAKITDIEREELLSYSHMNFEFINEMIYTDKDFREMVKKGLVNGDDLLLSAKRLNRALRKTGLLENTVLYRYGHWDEEMKAGDIGVWDGLTSTTYQKSETEWFDTGENRRLLKIYAPYGTNGLVINEGNGLSYHNEHEFLMGTGVRYYVLSTNKSEVEILVLPKV